jgi:hypothetical protein
MKNKTISGTLIAWGETKSFKYNFWYRNDAVRNKVWITMCVIMRAMVSMWWETSVSCRVSYVVFFKKSWKLYLILVYFPGVARVFIYPNLIVICVPSLAEIAHLDGIFSIITSTLHGGTLPTRGLIYILLHLRTNYSVAASSLSHHILSLYCSTCRSFI